MHFPTEYLSCVGTGGLSPVRIYRGFRSETLCGNASWRAKKHLLDDHDHERLRHGILGWTVLLNRFRLAEILVLATTPAPAEWHRQRVLGSIQTAYLRRYIPPEMAGHHPQHGRRLRPLPDTAWTLFEHAPDAPSFLDLAQTRRWNRHCR